MTAHHLELTKCCLIKAASGTVSYHTSSLMLRPGLLADQLSHTGGVRDIHPVEFPGMGSGSLWPTWCNVALILSGLTSWSDLGISPRTVG